MNKYLLLLTSLTAMTMAAQPPTVSKTVSVNPESYALSASPLPYATVRHNTGGRRVSPPHAMGRMQMAPAKSQTTLNVAINGFVAYSDNDPQSGAPVTPKGMYRVDNTGFTNLDATDFSQDLDASYGGTVAGDSYYCAYVWDSQTSEIGLVPFLQQWDTSSWNLTDANFCDASILGWDWTYDPVSKRIYGLFPSGDKPVLGVVDVDNRTRTDIGQLDRNFVSIAASADGVLYGIDFEAGQLWTINPANGSTTFVGSTGVTTAYTASACYDQYSGKILWTPTSASGDAALYAIDPATASTVKVMDFPAGEQVLGIYAVAPPVSPGVPLGVSDMTFDFPGGALSGNVSFTTPAANQDGSTSDSMTCRLTVDGEEVHSATVGYAQTVTVPVSVGAPGMHTFAVTLATAQGDGPERSFSSYVGFGIPKAPVATVTREGSVNHLSWTAVTETADGGYIDPAAVTYDIVRQPGSVAVAQDLKATSLDDVAEAEHEFSYFYYELTACNGGRRSEKAFSNRLDSGHITPPYLQTFDDDASLEGFTILDINDDGIKWVIDGQAAYLKYNSQLAADDWLISPPVVLEAGKTYRVSADVKGRSASYEEKFSISLGDEARPEAMTIPVVGETAIKSATFADYGEYVSVPATGLYFIGVHGFSDKNKYALIVDNLSVSAPTSLEAPGEATGLHVVPSPDGTPSATVSLTAPEVNLGGGPLSEITKLTVSRAGQVVKTFDNPQPGETLPLVITADEEGEYTCTAVAENSHGTGKELLFKLYLGVNVPGNPANITAGETKPGTVCVSWDAPANDADGNPMNADLIQYTLYRPNEDGYMVALARDLSETSYTYLARPTTVEQAFESYGVQAKTRRGVSAIMRSRAIPVGTPYDLPYIESYAGGYAHHIWSERFITGGEWDVYDDSTLAGLSSVDGDGGFVAMYSNIATEKSMLHTGKIDLADAQNPVLTFYTYNIIVRDPDTGEVAGTLDQNLLEVLINDRTQDFVVVKEMSMDQLPLEGWNRITVDLSAYKGKVIELGFAATTVNKQYNLLDDIRVFDQLPHNLTATAISAPDKAQPNVGFNVAVTLENNGSNPSEAYTVELTRNGASVATIDGPQLESGARATVTFPQMLNVTEADTHDYAAIIHYGLDNLADDNLTKTVTTRLVHSGVPVPTGLAGNAASNGVNLTWAEPDLNVVVADEVTDDFESYESFAQDNIGGWTLVDNDGLPIGDMSAIGMPGITRGSTLAWFVNDASFAGWQQTIDGHSGDKFLATVYSEGGANDDWIISPRLAGNAQTISFYARSYNARYLESMEMLYSSTDDDLESFTSVRSVPSVDASWKLYTFDIPEGSEYFAIRCVSDDKAMLFVDDITYAPYREAIMEVDGYNIYRDGERVNDDPALETAYVDNVSLDVTRTYSYAVSALYGQTESRASEPVEVAVQSALAAASGSQAVVSASPGLITVSGCDGLDISITDLSGRVISQATARGTFTAAVAPGVYIVKAGATVNKLLVP